MTARDELARQLFDLDKQPSTYPWWRQGVVTHRIYERQADVLLAAGWRKMPSAEALTDFIAEQRDAFPRRADDMDSGDLADAILALMDGDNE